MKKIALVSEGKSSTALSISNALANVFKELGYGTEIIFIDHKEWITNEGFKVDKNDFSIFKKEKIYFDCAYIYSEGIKTKGYIQGYLSLLKIPYISSSPLATMLATNKFFCKKYLQSFGIIMPQGLKLNGKTPFSLTKIVAEIGFPCIVKPNIGTDSIRVEKVDCMELLKSSIDAILENQEEVLIEAYIEGREFTCGVISTPSEIVTTPITEILQLKEPFYNYASKINRNNFKKTPATLSNEQTLKCQSISKKIFEILELDDFIRIDFILKDDLFYFLEVNVTPGMSERSNLPIQLSTMGKDLNSFLDQMIKQNLLDNR
jgi:D-alanine-D-alanine ligase